MQKTLLKPSRRVRALGGALRVSSAEAEAGMLGGGRLAGVSVITKGAIEGHDLYADVVFLEQVAAAINANEAGVKARFAHPGVSDDGLGRFLGRVHSASVIEDHVVATLDLAASAHDTPDGNLARYIMHRAHEDGTTLGLSIVYTPDSTAEAEFMEQHTQDGVFRSPDADNDAGLAHARLGRLHAVDVVDEPAANPDGLFALSRLGHDIFALLDYATGLADSGPKQLFGVASTRVRGAVRRWLKRRRLAVVSQGEAVLRTELAEAVEKYGVDGVRWLLEGLTLAECEERHLRRRLAELEEARNNLQSELNAARSALESVPVGVQNGVSVCYETEPTVAVPGLTPGLARYAASLKLRSQ